jgi:F-type H+-transporting ATPase subunit a
MPSFMITLAAGPDAHVWNHVFTKNADGYWTWSGQMGNLVLSGIITILALMYAASKIKTGPASDGTTRYLTTNKFAHLIEVFCVYLRDEVARPLLKDRTDRLMPILWTFFFFILVNNLLGMVPIMDVIHVLDTKFHIAKSMGIDMHGEETLAAAHMTPFGGTATQNIWVTGVLAVLALIIFNGAAVMRLGIGGFLKHLTADAPFYVWPIIVPIEFAGQILIKPAALAIRLFANMTAGHILLAALYMFVATGLTEMSIWGGGPVSLVSVIGAICITFLELFVAFLQAFIFMFLIAVFISLMDHHEDHEHGHEHEHDHAKGHEHAHA